MHADSENLGSRTGGSVPQGSASRTPVIGGTGEEYPFLLPAVEADEIGRLGNYRVLSLLGKGGMAFVFLAEDITLRRRVALKVMKPDLDRDLDAWPRFLREARIMAAIKHQHLVTVYQVGQEQSVVWLAMELLEGKSLEAWLIEQGVPSPAEALRLSREMASALEVVHQQGLIHRDIKPGNIWLESPGQLVKLLDFGLARMVHDDAKLTQSGVVMGTPAFMSPEQACGEPLDARSDLFSLGCVLYCICTGQKPFRGENTLAVLTALAVDTPQPVHELNPTIPRPLVDLVMQLLEKEPEKRPGSAGEVLERLKQCDTWFAEKVDKPVLAVPVPDAASSKRRVVNPADAPPPTSASAPASQADPRWLRWAFPLGLAVLAAAVLVIKLLLGSGGSPATPSRVSRATSPVKPTQPVAVGGKVYISDLNEEAAVGWPMPRDKLPPGVEPEPGSKNAVRVRVKGQVSPHGLFMHPPPPEKAKGPPPPAGFTASISYRLDKGFRTFHAEVSLNDTAPPDINSMTFVVYGDDKEKWRSKKISSQADQEPCRVPVDGVDVLRIEVQFPGPAKGAHAVWIEPYLVK